MEKLWNWVDSKQISEDSKNRLFLLLNCLKYGFLGYVVWVVISFVAFNNVIWAICFTGYSGLFIGYFGGILFLCRK